MSEHEDLLRELDTVAAFPLQGGAVARKAAAAIRKLEAERDAWKVDAQQYCQNADYWRAELQALREATSWRPIESAPKHKRLLVVGAQGAGYEIAHPYQIIEGGQWRWWSGNETLPFAPTHWMPLPAPPTREEEG